MLNKNVRILIMLTLVNNVSGCYNYKVIKEVGDRTFRVVYWAINKQSNEVVSVIILMSKFRWKCSVFTLHIFVHISCFLCRLQLNFFLLGVMKKS